MIGKFRTLKKSNLKAPKVNEPETQRAIEKIYDDLNKLIDGVNNTKGSVTEEYDGETGDIRLVKSQNGVYTLEAKGDEGWVTAVVNGIPVAYTTIGSRQRKVGEEQDFTGPPGATGATGPQGAQGPAGPAGHRGVPGFGIADYESAWHKAELTHLWYNTGSDISRMVFNHNFNELPYIIKVYYAPISYNPNMIEGMHGLSIPDSQIDAFIQIDTGHIGSSTGGQMKYGTTH